MQTAKNPYFLGLIFYLGWEHGSFNKQVYYIVSLSVIKTMNMGKYNIDDKEKRYILNSVFRKHLILTIMERPT